MRDSEALFYIKKYISSNKTVTTVLVTALVTAMAIYKWLNTNVIFISTPSNVKLELFKDLDGPDSVDLHSTTFRPQIPKYLVVHMTENYPNDLYYDYFENWFLHDRGWGKMGYHKALNPSGSVVTLTPINGDKYLTWDEIAYHTAGYNSVSVSVAIVGGLTYGLPKSICKNTMTFMQKVQLENTIRYYRRIWPDLKILGHRDLASKDTNKNGKIDPSEWKKDCPCFDIRKWIKENTDIDPK